MAAKLKNYEGIEQKEAEFRISDPMLKKFDWFQIKNIFAFDQ